MNYYKYAIWTFYALFIIIDTSTIIGRIEMGLRLILGRSGSGKTKLCIDEILEKQKLEKNKNLISIPYRLKKTL